MLPFKANPGSTNEILHNLIPDRTTLTSKEDVTTNNPMVRKDYALLCEAIRDHRQMNNQKALSTITILARKYPTNIDVLYYRARICFDLGQYVKCQWSFEKALSIDPDNSCLLYNYGLVLQSMEQHAQALKLYQQALKKMPSNIEEQSSSSTSRMEP